jgi:antitoxin HicB
MNHELAYPVDLTPDADGGFIVTFPGIPEAITQGDNAADALAQATDAIEEAVAGRIRRGDDIPVPAPCLEGQRIVPVPALTAAKAALYLALRQEGITKSELAARLMCDEKEVRRLLDPRHPSKLPRIQKALAALGKTITVRLVDEAA